MDRTFLVPRNFLGFITIVWNIRANQNGLHLSVESRLFGIRVRQAFIASFRWTQIAAVEAQCDNDRPRIRIVPVQPALFIQPLKRTGPIKLHIKVDEAGAWPLPLTTGEECRELAKICCAHLPGP